MQDGLRRDLIGLPQLLDGRQELDVLLHRHRLVQELDVLHADAKHTSDRGTSHFGRHSASHNRECLVRKLDVQHALDTNTPSEVLMIGRDWNGPAKCLVSVLDVLPECSTYCTQYTQALDREVPLLRSIAHMAVTASRDRNTKEPLSKPLFPGKQIENTGSMH